MDGSAEGSVPAVEELVAIDKISKIVIAIKGVRM